MMFESWYLGMKCCCVERVVGGMACLLLLECPKAALRFHLNFHFHRVRAIFSTCLSQRPPSCKVFRYTYLPPTPLHHDSCRRCAFHCTSSRVLHACYPSSALLFKACRRVMLQRRLWRYAATCLRKYVVSALVSQRSNARDGTTSSSPR